MRIVRIYREIKNFLSLLKIIEKEKLDSPKWAKLNLRSDSIGRIYTVINLPPEVVNSNDFPKEAKPAWVFDETKTINKYFLELNLQEILTVRFSPIPDTDDNSYLVVYSFVWRELTTRYVISRILLYLSLFMIYLNYSYIYNLIITLIS